MNIVFRNKLSFDCFHNMRHIEQLSSRFKDFLFSSWIDIEQIQSSPNSDRPMPDYRDISGYISEVEISVCGNDCYLTANGIWYTREFDWIIWRYDVDEYGYKKPDTNKRIINGALIDHGTPDNPSWSSHT